MTNIIKVIQKQVTNPFCVSLDWTADEPPASTGKNQCAPDFVKTVCQLWNSYEFHNGTTVWKFLFPQLFHTSRL